MVSRQTMQRAQEAKENMAVTKPNPTTAKNILTAARQPFAVLSNTIQNRVGPALLQPLKAIHPPPNSQPFNLKINPAAPKPVHILKKPTTSTAPPPLIIPIHPPVPSLPTPPQNVSTPELLEELATLLTRNEGTYAPNPLYFERQREIVPRMRTILIDWLSGVQRAMQVSLESFFLAITILDRFLSIAEITKLKYQLVGMTCLFIGVKYCDKTVPPAKAFISYSDNTYLKEEMFGTEEEIVNALGFNFTYPTVFHFVEFYSSQCCEGVKQCWTTRYFAELLVTDTATLTMRPSAIAAGAVYSARVIFESAEPWPESCAHQTGYSEMFLKSVAASIHKLLCQSAKDPKAYFYISKKYSSQNRSAVTTEVSKKMEVFASKIH